MLGSIDKETGEVIGIALEDALLPTLPELPSRRLVTRRSDPPSSRKVQIAEVGDLFKEPSLGNARILEDQLTGLSNSDPTLTVLSLPPVDDFVLGHSVLLPFVFLFSAALLLHYTRQRNRLHRFPGVDPAQISI
jgi:hypothetical protein